MTRIETIKNAIKTKLQGVSHLRHVYTYPKGTPEGYPYATLTYSNGDGEFADYSAVSKRNLRTHNFLIQVFVDKDDNSFGGEKAERVSIEALDEITHAFDMDVTLSGTVLQVTPVSWSGGYDIIGNAVRVADLTISCKDLVDAR